MLQIKRKERMKLHFALIVALAGAVVVSGCAPTRTLPLKGLTLNGLTNGYRYNHLKDDTLIAATFSGGGMRAAALAYGALTALKETKKLENGRELIDEVDLVSSVSGGSVTAAYWALKGPDGLKNLEERFLRKNVERQLIIETAVNPIKWLQLSMPSHSRIDIFRDYLKEELFERNASGNLHSKTGDWDYYMAWDYINNEVSKGATYQNLMNEDDKPKRPYLILNTTDMETGKVFSFTQDNG